MRSARWAAVLAVHHLRRAEHWRSGRVLLLGAAAHMTPPWAGQGMCAHPRAGLAPGIVAAWERLNPRWLTVRPVEEPLSHEGEIADVDQTLVPLMRRFGAIYVAVRPDRYLFDAGRHTIAPPWAKLQPQPEDGEAATDRPPSLVTS